jgi:hypothetical protein
MLLIDKFATNVEGQACVRGHSTNDKHPVGVVNACVFRAPWDLRAARRFPGFFPVET